MTVLLKCLVVFSITLSSSQAESPLWKSGVNTLWSENCNFDGNTIQEVRSLDGNCGRLCFEDSECTRFTWTDRNGGTCQFRSGNGVASIVQNGGICGFVSGKVETASNGMTWRDNSIMWTLSRSENMKFAHGCSFNGSVIKELKNALDDCMRECDEQDECFGFTYMKSSRNCRLRSRGGSIKLYIRTDVCGEKLNRNPQPASSDAAKKMKAEDVCHDYKRKVSAMLNPNEHQIYSGRLAQENEFPWMAALFYIENGEYKFVCGGTIISDYYILTAAHCLRGEDYDIPVDVVRLGTSRWNDSESETILVKERKVHEEFNWNENKNDIGLIKLRSRITISRHAYPACLRVDGSDLPRNQELIVSGWGKTAENNTQGDISYYLKKTRRLETVTLEKCQTAYRQRGSHARWNLKETQYCAAVHNENTSDVRKGDSGGPLQMFEDTHVATIVGIVSSSPDGSIRCPGIFTRVASYVSWIVDNVWIK